MRRLCVFAIVLFAAWRAAAQVPRTFVASSGLDTNACSRVAPCRTFGAAIAAVQSGGEVIVLDSAGYGPVSVYKAVSLIAPQGVYAGIAATTGSALYISVPSGVVTLRGITLGGYGATSAITVDTVGDLYVDECVIRNFNLALFFATTGDLFVRDSEFSGNISGVMINPDGANATATIERCRFENHASEPVDVVGPATNLTIRDSVFAQNTFEAIYAYNSIVDVKNCVITGNRHGIIANGTAVVTVSRSSVVNNVYCGFYAMSGATLRSFGNNELTGNGWTTQCGTITQVALQ